VIDRCLIKHLRKREQRNLIGFIIVAFRVDTLRYFAYNGKHLKRHVGLLHPRQIDMPMLVKPEKISVPQQHVGSAGLLSRSEVFSSGYIVCER
jgi:hypothetical protein